MEKNILSEKKSASGANTFSLSWKLGVYFAEILHVSFVLLSSVLIYLH